MIRIKKVLNTSVVLVKDETGAESILLGKGIGFGKKAGEKLQEELTTSQLFIPINHEGIKQIVEMANAIAPEIFDLAYHIVHMAKAELRTSFHDNVYFILADHLSFALDRYQKGMKITNRLQWEIQSFYPKEYETAKNCLSYINRKMQVHLSEEEAVNIAFHLINAQSSHSAEYDSARYAKTIGELVNLVRYSLNRDFQKESIHYLRFVTHIRFFVERFFTDKMLEDSDENFYLHQKNTYQKEADIANRIKEYLYEKYQKLITDEEMSFLMIHINRLIR